MSEESPLIRRDTNSVLLLNERYRTPSTSLILFHFEPKIYAFIHDNLKQSIIHKKEAGGRWIVVVDHFFSKAASMGLTEYSRQATFSRSSYADHASRESGEEPARSMNNKEKWQFFANPPEAIKQVFKLLSTLAKEMDADISTLPWDICDEHICASAVATNRLERASKASEERGKHEDFNTKEGIPFAIPILYPADQKHFPGKFLNGGEGNPWLVTLMVYASEANFDPETMGLGTLFYDDAGILVFKGTCVQGRIVIFEGDIVHTIQESHIPEGVATWRVSYVFKLIINPKKAHVSNLREKLFSALEPG